MAHNKRTQRRGNAAVVGLSLTSLLGFGALAVDVGFQRMMDLQLQSACDSAALAGSSHLNGDQLGVYAAIDTAIEVGGHNIVGTHAWSPTADNVEIGKIDDNGDFVSVDPAQTDGEGLNAIRVTGADSGNTVLGRMLGFSTLNVDAQSTVVRPFRGPASAVRCYLPFALPVCHFVNQPDGATPRMKFIMNVGNQDNIGWGLPVTFSLNAQDVKTQLSDGCGTGGLSIEDDLNIGNGQLASAVNMMSDIINGDHPTQPEYPDDDVIGSGGALDGQWPPNRSEPDGNDAGISDINPYTMGGTNGWGWTVKGPVAMVDLGGTGDCTNINFNSQVADIVGFTYGYVYDTKMGGAGDNNIWLQFDFETQYDIGTDFDPNAVGNVWGQGPGIVIY